MLHCSLVGELLHVNAMIMCHDLKGKNNFAKFSGVNIRVTILRKMVERGLLRFL